MAVSREPTARRELVLTELLENAAEVFAERGFRKATLDDIARRLGVSRAALYYYVDGKEDLLRQVMATFTGTHARFVERLRAREDLSPSERLHEAITAAVRVFETHGDVMRVYLRDEGELPDSVRAAQRRFRREVDDAMQAIIADGIASGDFREIDPEVAAYAIFGMLNWLHTWFRPDRPRSVEQIADTLSDLVLGGLIAGRGHPGPRSIESAVAILRDDLAQLEREMERLRKRQRDGGRRR